MNPNMIYSIIIQSYLLIYIVINPRPTCQLIIDQDNGLEESLRSGSLLFKSFLPKLRVRRQAVSNDGISRYLLDSMLSSMTSRYDAREIGSFLENHPAHSIHDPRAYFTEERTTRSLAIMLKELPNLPSKLRFAYVVRVFNELGRKIATKLNYYSAEVIGILKKKPDDLGNKPDVNMLVDAINNAFESKEDNEIRESSSMDQSLAQLLAGDGEKSTMFNTSTEEISKRLAHVMTYFTLEANKTCLKIPDSQRETMSLVLGEALQMGCWTMVKELSSLDKFKVSDEVILFTDKIIQMALTIYNRHIKEKDDKMEKSVVKSFQSPNEKSFKDLNFISDKTGLIGPWNSFLFSNLGCSERVIKLFASLLTRVPLDLKSRWFNMYISQVNLELERTMTGFVFMLAHQYNRNSSDETILNSQNSSQQKKNSDKLLKPRALNYSADKNLLPARCYLAGRRWRLVLMRSLQNYPNIDEVYKRILLKINQLKFNLTNQVGGELYRLCLPRLEVGLKGYSINGEPETSGSITNDFSLKNPIQSLDTMKDPFSNGAQLGYKLGVKVGYNEERNATLEMENAGNADDARSRTLIDERTRDDKTGDKTFKQMKEKIAKSSYRKAVSVAAKKAFEIAVHEGYLTTLQVSMKAGIQLLVETASKMASLKCVNFGITVGREAGRSVAENYLQEKKVSEDDRKKLIEVAEKQGKLAGKVMGQTIGSIVGSQAAEEAYKRNIVRGGKLARAKFHLEEYEAGANLGFDYGLKEGKRIGSSANLDPSAPNYLRFNQPLLYSSSDNNTSGSSSDEHEVDHWENELIPRLTKAKILELEKERNHTVVSGSLKGTYKVAKEVKIGLDRVSFTNTTHSLEVSVSGFVMNDVAYLILNGTVNKLGSLRGSLIAKNIFNDNNSY